ncbi:MAG TPA: IS3 family transposase, partial [Cytophagales bacterium]|nr:IS3 family transposase [Cytophagales bacterium]
MSARQKLVCMDSAKLSIRKQCDLLRVHRSGLYYQPQQEKPENVKMMNLMDRHLLHHPTEGVESMVLWLRDQGFPVGPKRIRRLFRLMGYQSIYRR